MPDGISKWRFNLFGTKVRIWSVLLPGICKISVVVTLWRGLRSSTVAGWRASKEIVWSIPLPEKRSQMLLVVALRIWIWQSRRPNDLLLHGEVCCQRSEQ